MVRTIPRRFSGMAAMGRSGSIPKPSTHKGSGREFMIHGFPQEAVYNSRLLLADGRSICAASALSAEDTRSKPRSTNDQRDWCTSSSLADARSTRQTFMAHARRYTTASFAGRRKASGSWRALAGANGPPARFLIDSSAVKAHRCAFGTKEGTAIRRSSHRPNSRTARMG